MPNPKEPLAKYLLKVKIRNRWFLTPIVFLLLTVTGTAFYLQTHQEELGLNAIFVSFFVVAGMVLIIVMLGIWGTITLITNRRIRQRGGEPPRINKIVVVILVIVWAFLLLGAIS